MTINELRLNCNLLKRFRYVAIKKILDEIRNEISVIASAEIDFDRAIEIVMEKVFDPDADEWPAFFSSIRAKFGETAEKRLKEIGYDG